MKLPDLLPCPFCGGEGRLFDNGDEHPHGNGSQWVACTNTWCKADGRAFRGSDDSTSMKAVEFWNKRA